MTFGLWLTTFTLFLFTRLRTHSLFFQQEEYDAKRFGRFACHNFTLVDKRLTICLLILFALSCLPAASILPSLAWPVIASLLFILFSITEYPLSTSGKKPLHVTARVKRIWGTTLFLHSLLTFAASTFFAPSVAFFLILPIFSVQLLPLSLVLGNFLLIPVERYFRTLFIQEAKAKLTQIYPTIIGITGSYGKTSTKTLLAHVLGSATPTLATPGSINTVLGISKIIRETLTPSHRFFISEMGAYGIGSIARLCGLTPPKHGILTSIGHAHYERFKSIETVAKAKFELAQAILQQGRDGLFVVAADAVDSDLLIKHLPEGILPQIRAVGSSDTLAGLGFPDEQCYIISQAAQTAEGTSFLLTYQGSTYTLKAPLFGTHNVTNIACVFALTHSLGMPVSTILAALQTAPQTRHRLEVINSPNSATIIDDAYNANPAGFHSALGVLTLLQKPNGRRILLTPGMVELGDMHNEQHRLLGELAAKSADTVLLVRAERIPTFVQAFQKAAKDGQELLTFPSFVAAKTWLNTNAKPTDVILYENDLPDLYESTVRL